MNELSKIRLLILTRELAQKINTTIYAGLCHCSIQPNSFNHDSSLYPDNESKLTNDFEQSLNQFISEHIHPFSESSNANDSYYLQSMQENKFQISLSSSAVENGVVFGGHYSSDLKSVKGLSANHDNQLYVHDNKIFISYSDKDRLLVHELKNYLEIFGYTCFVADGNIRGGQNWPDEIQKNLQQMNVFIACITPNFQTSIYCHQECGYAMAREDSIKIIPLAFGKEKPKCMLNNKQAVIVNNSPIQGGVLAKIYQSISYN